MKRLLFVLLLLALLLRLGYIFSQDPQSAYGGGGDSALYLQIGRDLLKNPNPTEVVYRFIPIPVAPLYLIVVGLPQQVLSPEMAVRTIQILQAILGLATCYFAYRIGRRLSQDERVGLLACAALAMAPSFVMEAALVLTESAYIFLVMAALFLYVDVYLSEKSNRLRAFLLILLIGVLLGLATLTRAVLMLFPFGLAIHMFLIKRRAEIVAVLASFIFITLSWTAYTSLYYDWTAIVSNQFFPAFWRGAVEGDSSPSQNDEMLGEQSHEEQAAVVIASDPLAYIRRRIVELVEAYLQPHGTIRLGGESLKAMAMHWLHDSFSLDGFLKLINGQGFWPKLLIYLFHMVGLLGGLWGMWLSKEDWRLTLPLIGFIVYTSLLHLLILALPRYLFPTFPIYWIFAALGLVWTWDKLKGYFHGGPQNLKN
jgi:4-amino-4-deoxy-L-arabinose transferase-like glycosyltransferase